MREHVESARTVQALDASGAGVVASFVLGGGTLTGKYANRTISGRMSDRLDERELQPMLQAGDALRVLAADLDATAAALAIAFALANDRVASVLFGATTPEHLSENTRAVELLERLTPEQIVALRRIGD